MTFVLSFFHENFALMFSDSYCRINGKTVGTCDKTLIYDIPDSNNKLAFHFYGSLSFKENLDFNEFKLKFEKELNKIYRLPNIGVSVLTEYLCGWLNNIYSFSTRETPVERMNIMGFHLCGKINDTLVVYNVSNVIINLDDGIVPLMQFKNFNSNQENDMLWAGQFKYFVIWFSRNQEAIIRDFQEVIRNKNRVENIISRLKPHIEEYIGFLKEKNIQVDLPVTLLRIEMQNGDMLISRS